MKMLYKISTADEDFIPLTSTIQYNPSMAEQEILVCESIQIENDNLSEDIENFTVLLNTTEPSVSFMIQSAVIAIADDDSKYAVCISITYSVGRTVLLENQLQYRLLFQQRVMTHCLSISLSPASSPV